MNTETKPETNVFTSELDARLTIMEADRKLKQIQAESAQLKLDKEKGKLVPREQLESYQRQVKNLHAQVDDLESKLRIIREAAGQPGGRYITAKWEAL